MGQSAEDTGQAIQYQRREWIAQRIGWTVMGLVVVAALLGLLGGSGLVATAERTSPDGSLSVRYLRLEHYHGPSEFEVEVVPEAVVEGELRLWLDGDYVRGLEIDSIVPEPDRVQVEPERVVYVFLAGQPTAPLRVTFFIEHDGFWLRSGRLGVVDGEEIEFRQFVFP